MPFHKWRISFHDYIHAVNTATWVCDVVLPFPVEGHFTYILPDALRARIEPGHRVVVQFGPVKIYTAIVLSVYELREKERELKAVIDICGSNAACTVAQLQFWEWLSEYYMCSIGDAMNTALPAVLKLNSETQLISNPLADTHGEILTPEEDILRQAIQNRGQMTIADVQQLLERKKVMNVVQSLLDRNIISLHEELLEKLKPRSETFVKLHEHYAEADMLRALLSELEKSERSRKQAEGLLLFLQQKKNADAVMKRMLRFHPSFSASAYSSLLRKEILVEEKRMVSRLQENATLTAAELKLSTAQETACAEIEKLWSEKACVLLHGVTGSGKTELYIWLAQKQFAMGKKVLLLLPEIALTTQLTLRLQKFFGNRMYVYHSRINEQQRAEIYTRVLQGDYDIVIGARSALMLPLQNCGLIIVDEEHDASYKQLNQNPHYHARDAAVWLGAQLNAKVLLGSATPSLETYSNASSGKFGLVNLNERYGNAELPAIQIIDLKQTYRRKQMQGHFSQPLIDEMQLAHNRQQQTILFLNKRGYARYVQCDTCGYSPHCKRCEAPLSYHKHFHKLICHLCGWNSTMITTCPQCKSSTIHDKGFGTEKIEEELKNILPAIRCERMDYDTTRGKKNFEALLDRFAYRELDVLAGTQMVTKGLDFEHVKLVGVLHADQLFHFPDFRSEERAFQLLTQVSGRAGRKGEAGKVLIQTFEPAHPVIQQVVAHDYPLFYTRQMQHRSKFMYPPYTRLVHVTIKHRDKDVIGKAATTFANHVKAFFGENMLGPIVPHISKINNYYLREMLFKLGRGQQQLVESKQRLKEARSQLLKIQELKASRILFNVDP